MKTLTTLTALVALASQSFSSPVSSNDVLSRDLRIRHQAEERSDSIFVPLEKRRGGGGAGGAGGRGSAGGSSGGSSGSSSGGSTGSSTGSSGGSSGGSRGSGTTGSSGGSTGGSTGGTRGVTSSSSSSPTYGGGRYYGGGSSSAYSPGLTSRGGITPFLIGGAGLGILAATWPHGAYVYGFDTRYNRHNDTTNQNQTLPVECLCDPTSACGCDDTHNATFIDSFFYPNGTSRNESVARIQNVNGTDTVILNGSLPNGTESDTGAAFGSSALSSRGMIDAVLAAGLAAGFMLL